jgi:hypothetical protein
MRQKGPAGAAKAAGILGWAGAIATALMAAFIAATTFAVIVQCWLPIPLLDQWAYVGRDYFTVAGNYIVQHNAHRPATLRLILAIDTLFDQRNLVVVGSYLLFTAIAGFGMAGLALRMGWQRRSEALWAAGVGLAVCLSAVQWENLHWAFEVCYVLTDVLAVAAFVVLAADGPVLLAVLFEVLAAYTLANGILASLLALPLAWALGRSRRDSLVLACAALLLFAAYLLGGPGGHWHPDDGGMRVSLGPTALYLLAEIGTFFTDPLLPLFPKGMAPRAVSLAIGLGAAGLVALLAVTLRCRFLRRDREPVVLVLLATAWWGVATAAMTAAGRVQYGIDQALTSRYTTFLAMLWAPLLLLLAYGWPGRRRIPMLLGVLAVGALSLSQPRLLGIARDLADGGRAALPAMLARVGDPLLVFLDDHPLTLIGRSEVLAGQHLAVFADPWAGWLGTPVGDHLRLVDPSRCAGQADVALAVGEEENEAGWRFAGQAKDSVTGRAIRRLILADADGRVAGWGAGALTHDYSDVAAVRPAAEADRWVGAARTENPEAIAAFALLDDGNEACPLGEARRIVRRSGVTLTTAVPPGLPLAGNVESVISDGDGVVVNGWGWLGQDTGQSAFGIATDLPVTTWRIIRSPRPDVVQAFHDERLASAGFSLRLVLDGRGGTEGRRLCLWTEDAVFGKHLLPIPSRPDLCPAASGP